MLILFYIMLGIGVGLVFIPLFFCNMLIKRHGVWKAYSIVLPTQLGGLGFLLLLDLVFNAV